MFVLITGTVSDRYNRRVVMGICIGVEALCTAAIAAFWILHARGIGGDHVVWPVFADPHVVRRLARVSHPAMQSLTANVVPREAFANAVAWNSSAMQASFTVGPAIGGLIYGFSSLAAYGTAFVMFAIAALLVILIPKPAQKTMTEPRSLDTMLAGVRYIWSQPVVLGAVSLDLFAVLLGGATALLPVYARDILEVGPWGLGLLRSAAGVGALMMGVWLVRNPIRDHAGKIMFVGVAVYGLAIMIFGLSTTLWISIPALAIMGAADMISVNVRGTLRAARNARRRSRTRDRRQQRVHRSVERARRVSRRHHGGVHWRCARRRRGRRRHARGCRAMDAPVPAAVRHPQDDLISSRRGRGGGVREGEGCVLLPLSLDLPPRWRL